MSRKRAQKNGWAQSAVVFVCSFVFLGLLSTSASALDWYATQRANQSTNISNQTIYSDTGWGHDNKPAQSRLLRLVRWYIFDFTLGIHDRTTKTGTVETREPDAQQNLTVVGSNSTITQ